MTNQKECEKLARFGNNKVTPLIYDVNQLFSEFAFKCRNEDHHITSEVNKVLINAAEELRKVNSRIQQRIDLLLEMDKAGQVSK